MYKLTKFEANTPKKEIAIPQAREKVLLCPPALLVQDTEARPALARKYALVSSDGYRATRITSIR